MFGENRCSGEDQRKVSLMYRIERLGSSTSMGSVGGAQHGARVAEPQKPVRQCGSRKKARGRQALQTEMRGFKNMGTALVLKRG